MANNNRPGPGVSGGGNHNVGGLDLQFVSMNPSSQLEKQRNKKVIRSAAMKSFRRKQMSQKAQDKVGPVREVVELHCSSELGAKNNSLPDTRSLSAGDGANWLGGIEDSFSDMSWGPPTSPLSNSSSNSSESDSMSVFDEMPQVGRFLSQVSTPGSSVVSSPKSLLGAGRIDPFRIYPLDANNTIPELFDHSVGILWPGFSPESQMPAAWFRKAWERPIVMHALAFGAIVHMDVLRSPRLSLENPLRLFHKVQTMRLLKEEMKNPNQAVLDDVILAILTLSTNEVETVANNIKEKARSPFNSPLASIQWLDVYGCISHVKTHTAAMRSIIARRGGLENVELPGLAEVLFLSDVLGATQNLSKPHFPLLLAARDLPPLEIDRVLRFPLMKLGQAFESLSAFGVNERALRVLQTMVDLSMIIDGHTRGAKPIKDMASFILRRNAVQHSLTSLPSGEELEVGEVSSVCLYESIRHAAMIYSVAVTFPLPPLTGVFGKLSLALKGIMETSKFDPCWQLSPKTLLWILTLGGIAASGTDERAWYVQNLEAVSGALKLSDWRYVVVNIEEYLWLESACDNGGRSLWDEVLNDRFLQMGID
ncbi:hypothetical protein ACEPPN_010803 [Leptodophora sp. 'Broadleaf-Isolate-01']